MNFQEAFIDELEKIARRGGFLRQAVSAITRPRNIPPSPTPGFRTALPRMVGMAKTGSFKDALKSDMAKDIYKDVATSVGTAAITGLGSRLFPGPGSRKKEVQKETSQKPRGFLKPITEGYKASIGRPDPGEFNFSVTPRNFYSGA